MPATVEILSIPLGSQLTSTIGRNGPDDLNDFPVLLIFSENVDLTRSGVSVSAGSSIVAFEGKNSVYKATIRPPQTSGIVTVTVNRNAVSQGNPQTTKDIRVSTTFPDADAAVPTQLFSVQGIGGNGIAVSATEIFLNNQRNIHRLSHAGVLRETIDHGYVSFPGPLDYFNGQLIYGSRQTSGGSLSLPSIVRMYYHSTIGITKTAKGYLRRQNSGVFLHLFANPRTGVTVDAYSRSSSTRIASQGDLIYGSGPWTLSALTDDNELRLIRRLNIQQNASDIATYRDRLFILSGRTVYTLDIRKYRPLARNTKTTIYPVILPYLPHQQTQTLDLSVYSPNAEKIIFDVGFSLPNWLSIDTQNRLQISTGTMQAGEVRTCLLKLRGINRIDSVEFSFYLVIEEQSPRWRDIENLTMKANSSYDLFQLVSNATRIELHPNYALPTGASLANGIFTVGTTGGQIGFRAFNDRTRQWADMDNTTGVF